MGFAAATALLNLRAQRRGPASGGAWFFGRDRDDQAAGKRSMAGVQDLSERIEALETRLTYQDETIEALNQTVTAQWKQIDALTRRIAALSERLDQAETSAAAPANERPPHY
jgi:SlyX protein